MKKTNYNKLIPEILTSRKKPYPIHKYIHKSEKYKYVYYESLNGIEYWHARLDGIICYETKHGNGGFTSWDFYSDSEERCAKEIFRMINKYMRRIKWWSKIHDNGHYRKHINWQKWIERYELSRIEI